MSLLRMCHSSTCRAVAHTATAARRNIQDAVSLLLETSKERGTLTEILEEAGYRHEGRHWLPPEHISLDRLSVNLPA